MLDSLEVTLCDMQGKLFEQSAEKGFSSEDFLKVFMLSETASDLDKPFNHMQWAGEGYLLSRLIDENGNELKKSTSLYDSEVLYWIGYVYRYWHYYTGESSKEIYRQAPARTIQGLYLMYHSMSPEMAIDRMKDSYRDER